MKSDFKELLDAGWKNMSLQSIEIDSDGCLAAFLKNSGYPSYLQQRWRDEL